MKTHVLQHVPFEDIGSMADWLAAHGATVTYTRFFEAGATLPALDGIDLLIAMGGPMSINDERELPWLETEKAFVRAAIERGGAVLGICLGAQLMASALGANVYRNDEKEIGWFPVHAAPDSPHSFRFPESTRVFHWHGETFDLPPGAIRLAHSTACSNQAFQVGRRAIGLQFHLETTPPSAHAIIEHCRNELVPTAHIQTEAVIRAEPEISYRRINDLMASILSYLTASIQE